MQKELPVRSKLSEDALGAERDVVADLRSCLTTARFSEPKAIDWTSSTSIDAFLVSSMKQDLSDRFRLNMLARKIQGLLQYPPTFNQEMQYYRDNKDGQPQHSLQDGQKALQKVPIFTGESSLSWADFAHHMRVADLESIPINRNGAAEV
jgi:hypothetical protein